MIKLHPGTIKQLSNQVQFCPHSLAAVHQLLSFEINNHSAAVARGPLGLSHAAVQWQVIEATCFALENVPCMLAAYSEHVWPAHHLMHPDMD